LTRRTIRYAALLLLNAWPTPASAANAEIRPAIIEPAPCQASQAASASAAKEPLTVAASINSRRLMLIESSPDDNRFVAMLVRGDLAANRNWLEIYSGEKTSLAVACRARLIARLATSSLTDLGPPFLTVNNRITWVDNQNIAFLWLDERSRQQVLKLNIATGKSQWLTDHDTNVGKFSIGPDGKLFFAAERRHDRSRSQRMLDEGFSVSNDDAYSLIRGDVDGYGSLDRAWSRDYVLSRGLHRESPIRFNSRGFGSWVPHVMGFSPDGRFLLIDGTPEAIGEKWRGYNSQNYVTDGIAEALDRDPDGFLARQVVQLFIVDTRSGEARPLWDVPDAHGLQAIWSPDGEKLLVGPTFLPLDLNAPGGRIGRAVAIVDRETGAASAVPIPLDHVSPSMMLRWPNDEAIELGGGGENYTLALRGGQWIPGQAAETAQHKSRTTFEVMENANDPPRIMIEDKVSGVRQVFLEVDPSLRTRYSLGKVEEYRWQDASHRSWKGRLYLPVGYAKGRRYPLVIQTHGFAPMSQFSLYGKGPGAPGTGPGWSIYAAQALANRGIAVLQTDNVTDPKIFNSPGEAEAAVAALEGAVKALDAEGLIDPERVGLAGYSRTGWHVEYALAHSSLPFAAALASDNFDGSYFQATLMPGAAADLALGASPFGPGLQQWVKRSPGFNADKIRAPLRLQLESGGLHHALSQWELFSRLRQLKRPVEFYIIPDVENGSHALQNPRQVYAAQQGAVDWFDFWLNGYEDADPKKAEQYARWRQLRDLQLSPGAASQ
jgi:dipeptidyl aminopeptidase/acylaminoacyl peptidase